MTHFKKVSGIAGGDILMTQSERLYRVSDFSPNTGEVYGHPLNVDGEVIGDYQRIPFEYTKG